MKKVINISLSGHPNMFQADEAAYDVLRQYLERARARLKNDPDREEVIRDLEQSIAEKLAVVVGSGVEVMGIADVNAVLEEIGAVDGDKGSGFADTADQPPRRRLCRIKEGQQIAGVCQGLSAYSSVRVDWVRLVFLLLATSTAGVGALAYVVMMFALPIVSTREEYFAANRDQAGQM
ncbi:PspC domain-containing protein [Calidithermus chliarophilus]|uniref:PspC domain-containing protein n=1 Tax=Calidithermus chliarophilus TaxID=52023 RepID=UPI0006843B75|nr:PspC domain-containing protein [Calidithermus chliarophilus]